MRNLALRWLVFVGFLLLGSCSGSSYDPSVRVIEDENTSREMQAQLQKQALFDLSKVTVARLKVDERSVEVSSLLPVVLAQSEAGDRPGITILAISPDHSRLVLFTRSGVTGKGYRADVDLDEPTAAKGLRFPVAQSDGDLKAQTVTLMATRSR